MNVRSRNQNDLADNPNVQELFSILKENNKDTSGLTSLMSYIKHMEGFVKSAEVQMSDIKKQINELKEIQNHPIKTSLKSDDKHMESNKNKIKSQIFKIKENIITACKNAVTAFKDNGTIALDKLVDFFHIKQLFEAIEKITASGIKQCNESIDKIERFSNEYHATGRHLKNMVRMTLGKEPKEKPKEIGNLVKAICLPYKNNRKILNNICNT